MFATPWRYVLKMSISSILDVIEQQLRAAGFVIEDSQPSIQSRLQAVSDALNADVSARSFLAPAPAPAPAPAKRLPSSAEMLAQPFRNEGEDKFADGYNAFSAIAASKTPNPKPQTPNTKPLTACVLFRQNNGFASEYATKVSRQGIAPDAASQTCLAARTLIFTQPVSSPQGAKPARQYGFSYKECRCDLALCQKEKDKLKKPEKKRRRIEKKKRLRKRIALEDGYEYDSDEVSSTSCSSYNELVGWNDVSADDDSDDANADDAAAAAP